MHNIQNRRVVRSRGRRKEWSEQQTTEQALPEAPALVETDSGAGASILTIISWRRGGGVAARSMAANTGERGETGGVACLDGGGGSDLGNRTLGAVVGSTSQTVYPPLRKSARSRSEPRVHCVKPLVERLRIERVRVEDARLDGL